MLLYDEINLSPLYCSLYGAKRTFERQLKLSNMYYIFHNNKKAALTLNPKRDPTKPYAYFALQSVKIVKDQANNKIMRRSGMSHSTSLRNMGNMQDATNSTVHSFFMFPAELACELHYIDNDIQSLSKFLEVFIILAVTDCFNFKIQINQEASWITRLEVQDDTISIPEMDYESAELPAANELVIPFTIHTRLGFVRDVAKVNSDRPTITFGLMTTDELVETIQN